MPLTYFVGRTQPDRFEPDQYDGFLWCVDPDDLLGPDGGPRDPEPYIFATVADEGEAATLARLLNDAEAIKAQRDALLDACERVLNAAEIGPDVELDPDSDEPVYDDGTWFTVAICRYVQQAVALARRPS